MNYPGRVSVSYGPGISKLERLRAMDARYEQLKLTCDIAQEMWLKSSQSLDARRDACTSVAIAMCTFAVDSGVSLHAKERWCDLLVALDELRCGRRSVLLAPAPVHPGKFSASDLQQQGTAQLCVDLLRKAGASAGAARARVCRLFEKYQLPKFSEAKLRSLQSRLTGAGCTQDPAYDSYIWAQEQAARTGTALNLWPINTRADAEKLVDWFVALTKRRDHRRDFFFAPREDSSNNP